MLISALPSPYKEMALANQKLQGNEPDESKDLDDGIVDNNFLWDETKEGFNFWEYLEDGETPELTPEIKANYPDIFPVEKTYMLEQDFSEGKEVEIQEQGKSYTITDIEKAFKHCYQTGKVHPGNNMNKDWEAYKKTLITTSNQ